MMVKVKRVGVLFSALLQCTVMAFAGLIAGIFYSFGGFFYELVTGTLNWGTVLAFGALLGMPAAFAAFGFAFGLIAALLYNFAAKRFGGIKADLELER